MINEKTNYLLNLAEQLLGSGFDFLISIRALEQTRSGPSHKEMSNCTVISILLSWVCFVCVSLHCTVEIITVNN